MNLSSNLRVAVLMTAVTTHLFGVAYPLPMTAVAQGLAEADLRALLAAHVEGRQLGFPGEPRVNVLLVSLARDERWPVKQ